jgi:hypothetical protein
VKTYTVDRNARAERRSRTRSVERKYALLSEKDGKPEQVAKVETVVERSIDRAELDVVVAAMSRAFKGTIDFYKAEHGGGLSHAEAVKSAEALQESRRQWIREGKPLKEIDWTDLSAVAEENLTESVEVWGRVREAAVAELESGRRSGYVVGDIGAWEYAQFLAIRDAFADEWQPRGGIEAAMIDMLTIAYSLQMYWASIAHQRATRTHDRQKKDLNRFEVGGWKAPWQSEADAIEQANRLADGYNRQFLRILRQLRDLRRYAPPVIVNNGGQVNVASQQVNVSNGKQG